MKTLMLLLLLPFGCFAQQMEKNLFAESEIIELFLEVNPKLMDSPELNNEADRVINEWIINLRKDSIEYSLFEGNPGYMTICNMWKSKDLDSKQYYEMVLSTEDSTLVVKNAIGDNLFLHILGSYEIGVASYTIGNKERAGLDIYIALFR